MYRSMAETFPNAVIVSQYGMSDIENSPMGVPCYPMSDRDPLQVFHTKDGNFIELLDERGLPVEPEAGAEGEVVITAYRGEPAAFPTIRYRTGDTARVIETICPKHGTWSFIITGRVADDFLKVPGGVLKADEVERVLRLFPNRVTDMFELHVYGDADVGTPLRVALHVETEEKDLARLASDISAKLRISPSDTYAEGVARGTLLPLTCEHLPKAASQMGKRKRVIRHPQQ
jgi:phenylacetate-coenzyme A ligase PaaK-like adenylate-forming protein